MHVVHIGSSARGGAGIAAIRSVLALQSAEVKAEFWSVEDNHRLRFSPRWRARLDYAPLRLYPEKKLFTAWSNGWLASGMAREINRAKPDLVHLHWVGHGSMSLDEIERIEAPVVWTLHDAWAFTGGCHYPGNCQKYATACGACPQRGSRKQNDLSRRNWEKRIRIMSRVKKFIAPSEWLRAMSVRSGLVVDDAISIVRNTLDMAVFSPGRRLAARTSLGIPCDEFVFVVGSMELNEKRKGNHLLRDIFESWRSFDTSTRARLLVFGENGESLIPKRGIDVVYTGSLRDPARVADALAAADVLVMPSLQDNLPNIAVEAQACGCPVAGFDAGGLREIIKPGSTGWLAAETTGASLGHVLADFTLGGGDRHELTLRCRNQALALFSERDHAESLMKIYGEILHAN
jgi:glycosyltransferase involved in cell wall biosynthesis